MAKTLITYGDVVDSASLDRLKSQAGGSPFVLLTKTEPELFTPGEDGSTVFVDLEDPTFCQPEFLVSLATGGANVRLIGKAVDLDDASFVSFSKMGIAEVLTQDECLQRLEALLGDIENIPNAETKAGDRFSLDALIGESEAISGLRSTIEVLTDVDFPSALLLGETGTGKSLVSKILHYTGLRAEQNFVEVNCSAIPDDLFESELFGHVKGAFTDAKSAKVGLFEHAQGGTLFLDEVGNLSGPAQGKLLKILEDKKLRRVGDIEETDIDVRVVAATNMDLEAAVESGQFRADLFFRLNLLTIDLPPLSQRVEDIPVLAEYFVRVYGANYGKPHLSMEPDALELLQKCEWPGNVRELSNIIERCALLTKGRSIRAADTQVALAKGRLNAAERQQLFIDLPPQGMPIAQIEQVVVKYVLDMFDWNRTKAAQYLEISRPRLRRIIEAGGITQNRRKS